MYGERLPVTVRRSAQPRLRNSLSLSLSEPTILSRRDSHRTPHWKNKKFIEAPGPWISYFSLGNKSLFLISLVHVLGAKGEGGPKQNAQVQKALFLSAPAALFELVHFVGARRRFPAYS